MQERDTEITHKGKEDEMNALTTNWSSLNAWDNCFKNKRLIRRFNVEPGLSIVLNWFSNLERGVQLCTVMGGTYTQTHINSILRVHNNTHTYIYSHITKSPPPLQTHILYMRKHF